MCTAITIKSKQGDYFFGRTLDFLNDVFDDENDFKAVAAVYPKGCQLDGQLESWENQYAFGGNGINNTIGLYDGVNEAGLAGELNALNECTWEELDQIRAENKQPVIGEELISYMLSHFKSVAEVREAAKDLVLAKVDFAPLVNNKLFKRVPLHYIFVDPTGDSVVLEPLENGHLKAFKSLGVMTNSPTYDWHVTNLRNYVNLQGFNAGNTQLDATVNGSDHLLEQIGFGSGLLGIPGDYTSTSRFVRAAFLSRYIDDFDSRQGVDVLYSAFTSVMVPKGVERADENALWGDSTQYWSGYDLKNHTFYVKAFDTNACLKRDVCDFEEITKFEIPHIDVFC